MVTPLCTRLAAGLMKKKITHFLDLILSNPGNPNLIISATRLMPFWGSGGMTSLLTSGIVNCEVDGDNTAAVAADTVANFGNPGIDSNPDFGFWINLWTQNPAAKLLLVAKKNFNFDIFCLFTER